MENNEIIVHLAKISDLVEKLSFDFSDIKMVFQLNEKDFHKFYDDITKPIIKKEKINDEFILKIGKIQFVVKKFNKNNA
jgi:hypothetical protein